MLYFSSAIILFVGLYSLVYLAFLWKMAIPWRRLVPNSSYMALPVSVPDVLVVVPVRNEEANILLLLQCLLKQDYPAGKFQVFIMDDASTDQTASIATDFLAHHELPGKVISLQGRPMGTSPKKWAITQALAHSSADYVATTDGDCQLSPQWLRGMIGFAFEHSASFVFGPVKINAGPPLLEKMQQIEFASLVGSGAGTWKMGVPTMCNGANMAFNRKHFLEIGGYQGNWHVPSGDDEFLYHRFHKKGYNTAFCSVAAATVLTQPQHSWGALYQQRRRWASKWSHYEANGNKWLALFIFGYHTSWLLGWGGIAAGWLPLPWGGFLLLSKGIGEYVFLRKVLHTMKEPLSRTAFALLFCTYSIYVLFLGIISRFGNYTWKGRTWQNSEKTTHDRPRV